MRAFRGSSAVTRYYPGASVFNGPSSEINALQVSRLNSYYSPAAGRYREKEARGERIRGVAAHRLAGPINPGFCRRRDTSLHGWRLWVRNKGEKRERTIGG